MAGKRVGAPGPGPWPGAGSASLTCSPRKFSEKIALHTQRQAEDIAAFEEVMMDITSTRIQAQRVRQVRSLASYYGGSLPNVNQMSKCSTETQMKGNKRSYNAVNPRPFFSNTDSSCPTYPHHLRTDFGQRGRISSHPGRPSRRHTDSTPYLSFHLSPPSGPSCRRNCSSRSVNEKSQVDQLPVTTLSRTNSDSALHTSGRMTCIGKPNTARVFTACSRKTGTPLFLHSVPLIEENVQEELKPLKPQKLSSEFPQGDTTRNQVSLSVDPSCSLHAVPPLSTSGSLPDLSTLCLPSAGPAALESESSVHQLSNTAIMTGSDCPHPSLSPLQASTSNPLLPSSLSNPNLQTTLSSLSRPNSLSSTSLCLSLSNSSLQSSLSNQSLQSSLSSSSLSNQSVHSAASLCSYSSGIAGSRSCSSSSSLSCSPHGSRQVTACHTASTRKRTQLNPLVIPSDGESLGQQSKQFSPTVSPTLFSITQGVPLDTTKVLRETKPSAYRCGQLSPTGPSMAYHSMQHCYPEGRDQSRQDVRRHFQPQTLSSQPSPQLQYSQHPHNKTPQHLLNPHHYTPQPQLHEQNQSLHHQYQQVPYQQQSLQQPQQYPQTQQYLSRQSQQYLPEHSTQPLQHQQYLELNRCWNPQLVDHNQNQHYQHQQEGLQKQRQPLLQSNVVGSEDKDICWQNPVNQLNMPAMAVKRSHMNEPPKIQSKMAVSDIRSKRTAQYPKMPLCQRDQLQLSEMASVSSEEKEFKLHKDYIGLHLTPSQTEALSQKLCQLHKEPPDDSKCQSVEEKEAPVGESFRLPQAQGHTDEGLHCFPSINTTVPSSWLDDEISDLLVSVPEFDLETFPL